MRKNDRYEMLANSTPIDKTAALVANQSGCDGNIYNGDRETLEALGKQKRWLSDKVVELKRELKIKPNWNGKLVPRHILNNPKYSRLVEMRERLSKIDGHIYELRQILKNENRSTFEVDFISEAKKRYPEIYEEIKSIIKGRGKPHDTE